MGVKRPDEGMGGSSAPPGDLRRKHGKLRAPDQELLRRGYLSSMRSTLTLARQHVDAWQLSPSRTLADLREDSRRLLKVLREVEDEDPKWFLDWKIFRPSAVGLYLTKTQADAEIHLRLLAKQLRVLSHQERLRQRKDPLMSPHCPICQQPQVALEDVVDETRTQTQRMIWHCLRCRHTWEAIVRKQEDVAW